MKKHFLLIISAAMVIASCAHTQVMSKAEEEKALLDQFVQKGSAPSESHLVEGFPSVKKITLDIIKMHRIDLNPGGIFGGNKLPHIKDSKIGPPIVIHSFGKLAHDYRLKEKYYCMVPFYHPKAGFALGYYYHRGIDKKTLNEIFGIGRIITYGHPERPVLLLTPQTVKDLVQKKFGVTVQNEPIAVCYLPKNIGPMNETDWFWYIYFENGFTYQDKAIHSLFVVPFANVKDIDKATLNELLITESVNRNVSILDRFYTFEEEIINFYDLEQKRKYLGDAPLSKEEGNALYSPRLNFIPLE